MSVLAGDAGIVERHVRRIVRRGALHAYEAAYAPSSRLPDHEHASPFFTYVLRGGYVEQVGRLPRECLRGAVIFHPHNESHANVVGNHGTASLNVEITDDAWRELTADVVPACDLIGRVLSGDIEWMALAVWREFHNDDSASTLGLEETIAMLCAEVRTSSARGMFEPHQRLDRCTEYLRAHPTTTQGLSEVARIAGVRRQRQSRCRCVSVKCQCAQIVHAGRYSHGRRCIQAEKGRSADADRRNAALPQAGGPDVRTIQRHRAAVGHQVIR